MRQGGMTTDAGERYAWAAGIVFVLALVAEGVISTGVGLTQNDSAATIAAGLHAHEGRLLAVAALSIVYAVAFVVYLWKLHLLLRGAPERPAGLSTLVLIGLVLFVSLHAVSDIGITGMLGATVAAYSAQHDPGLAYVLYLLTFALDSVGDVFGSFGSLASGLLVLRTGVLPRWLGWVGVLAAPFLVLQAFGLGGVIATFGLVLDLIGFVLLLVFVAASSAVLLRRPPPQTTM
jgi:uncharacterized protein DUF4386